MTNDPLNLLAVEDHLNQQKGDGDAATWLPPDKSYRCEYVSRQIAVKAKYGLWVKPAEHDAMRQVLDGCADLLAFAGAVMTPDRWEGDGAREADAPKPKPQRTTKPKTSGPTAKPKSPSNSPSRPATSPKRKPSSSAKAPVHPVTKRAKPRNGGGSTTYKNCDAVRAAGAAPIREGDPGYSRKLDRDGDGIGCE